MLWVLNVRTGRIALIVLLCIQKYDFLTQFSLHSHVSSDHFGLIIYDFYHPY